MNRQIQEFVTACHQVAAHQLVQCSSGNLSWRIAADRILIKSSRAWIGRVTKADVCVCRLSDGKVLAGRRPSVELQLHLEVLRQRPDMNVVLHFQTPFATALVCRHGKRLWDYSVFQ